MHITRQSIRDGVVAGLIAAGPSGIPSTAHALATGRDPLEAARAAGTILLPNETRSVPLLLAAAPVHLAMSIGWGLVLAHLLPPRRIVAAGGLAGAGIAAIDLGAAARLWPRIRALPEGAQIADHVAFGALAGYVIARRRAARKVLDEGRPHE